MCYEYSRRREVEEYQAVEVGTRGPAPLFSGMVYTHSGDGLQFDVERPLVRRTVRDGVEGDGGRPKLVKWPIRRTCSASPHILSEAR